MNIKSSLITWHKVFEAYSSRVESRLVSPQYNCSLIRQRGLVIAAIEVFKNKS